MWNSDSFELSTNAKWVHENSAEVDTLFWNCNDIYIFVFRITSTLLNKILGANQMYIRSYRVS